MHLLRKIEDWFDLNDYLTDCNLYNSLTSKINRLNVEEKSLIRWKMNSISRCKDIKDNKILKFIAQNI